jgi:hypothetical protein
MRTVNVSIKNGPKGPPRGRNREGASTRALEGTYTVINHTARPIMVEKGVMIGTGKHRTGSGVTLTAGDAKRLLNRKPAILTATREPESEPAAVPAGSSSAPSIVNTGGPGVPPGSGSPGLSIVNTGGPGVPPGSGSPGLVNSGSGPAAGSGAGSAGAAPAKS